MKPRVQRGSTPRKPATIDPDSLALEKLREKSGLPLPLRILALVGAVSFLMIGINSLMPPRTPSRSPPLPSGEQASRGLPSLP